MLSHAALSNLTHGRPLPRLHVLSDLHLDSGPYELPAELDFDILIAAGDIGPLEVAVPWLAATGKPVVYVLGNHERYDEDLTGAVHKARALAAGTSVHVLERDAVVIQGMRFLGATLWTDLRGFQPTSVKAAAQFMQDYGCIRADAWLADEKRRRSLELLLRKHKWAMPVHDEKLGGVPLHPGITYREHQLAKRWLLKQLDKPFAGPTVVVTHHAPSFESLRRSGIKQGELDATRWGMRENKPAKIAGYASDMLSEFGKQRYDVPAIDLWVHGHVHHAMDYVEHRIRVLCNPRGRHQKPLTQESAGMFRLLGYPVREGDIERSQEQARLQPFAGDAWDFDEHLVIALEDGFSRPLRQDLAATVARLRELHDEAEALLPGFGTGNVVADTCVEESVSARLDQGAELTDNASKLLVTTLLGADTPQGLVPAQLRVGVWRLSIAFRDSDGLLSDPASRRRGHIVAGIESLAAAATYLEQAPDTMRRALEGWREKAQLALLALAKEGVKARAKAPARAVLRYLGGLEVALVVEGDLDEREAAIDTVVDTAVNGGKTPRAWRTRVSDQVEPGWRLLTLEDLQALR